MKKKYLLVFLLLFISLMVTSVLLLPSKRDSITPRPSPTSELGKNTADSQKKTTLRTKSSRQNITKNNSTGKQQSKSYTQSTKQRQVAESTATEHPYYMLAAAPNDPLTQTSWAYQNIKAPDAWTAINTAQNTTVAVIDSGFALNHEDLTTNWKSNSNESGMTNSLDRCWSGIAQDKATNNCDDDNNGYIDDWRGWDFVNVDNLPQTGLTNPTGNGVSHGTEVSGLVGATTDNGIGIASISRGAKILPLQVLDDNGAGYTSDIAAAVYYAVQNGANVINMSLGGAYADTALRSAIEYAYQNNVVVIAAAGNCGTPSTFCQQLPTGGLTYPALYPSVIAVGATDGTNQIAPFSSYGEGLDIVAPGSGSITSPAWSNTNQISAYSGTLYGTSYAAPIISSIVALIKSTRPNTSPNDIEALLLATTNKPAGMNGALFTTKYGHGLVNTQQSITIADQLTATANFTPLIEQTGGYNNEGQISASEMASSGCTTAAQNTPCAVRFTNTLGSYSRYLPYSLTNSEKKAGWAWLSSALLGPGQWEIRSQQGDNISIYKKYLLRKQ